MILADTSVLIAYLRDAPSQIERILLSGEVALCGVTRAELLHGARSEKDVEDLLRVLADFDDVPIPSSVWIALGRNLFRLRVNGITVAFQDALLATVAIEAGCELWSLDRHFSLIQSALPNLKLFAFLA
jgi:hypothetical protein